jgi:hypothetical protein
MAECGGGLTPREVVVVDDSTRYGNELCDIVRIVLGRGRAAGDRAECISHQEAISATDEFWSRCAVALVDSRDAHGDSEGTPVPVGDVVVRLNQLASPPRIIVYSANFDNPYFNSYVRSSAEALAYYDASVLLRKDGVAMRSALLDDEPLDQAEIPRPEQLGDLGEHADLAAAVSALRGDATVWRWALGFKPWGTVDPSRRRKVRRVARGALKMQPEARPMKMRDGQELKDRSPDHGSILKVLQRALGVQPRDPK